MLIMDFALVYFDPKMYQLHNITLNVYTFSDKIFALILLVEFYHSDMFL